MKLFQVFTLLFLLIGCSSETNNRTFDQLLCTFQTPSLKDVDFSIKFDNDFVEIKSWWIDRNYRDLVIDHHNDEADIFRRYEINETINIFYRSSKVNEIFMKIDRNAFDGEFLDQSVARSDLQCYIDPKAAYKMSLKIAIGKKNYESYKKQKGY